MTAPVLTEHEFALLDQFIARSAQLEPLVRDRLAASLAGRFAAQLSSASGSPAAALAELHARETERRHGPLAGAVGARAPVSLRARRRAGPSSAASPSGPPGSGLDSFRPDELPDFAARYREAAADLARARTYRADPPRSPSWSGWWRRGTTRCTATSDRAGAPYGARWRTSSPLPSCSPAATVLLAFLVFAATGASATA